MGQRKGESGGDAARGQESGIELTTTMGTGPLHMGRLL